MSGNKPMRQVGTTIGLIVAWAANWAAAAPPTLIKTERKDLLYTYLTYEHVPDATMRAPSLPPRACRFRVRLPIGVGRPEAIREPAPLLVSLHGRRGDYKGREKLLTDHVVLFPDDNLLRFVPTAWFGYHNQYPKRPDAQAVVEPYTVRRLVYCVRFVCQTFNVDRAAVWARGKSMGGAGALTLAVMHPELIAGARAIVAPVNAVQPGPTQLLVRPAWGDPARPLRVADTDATVWNHQSLAWQLCRDRRQLGWLHLEAGKDDRVVPFAQYTQPVDPCEKNVFEAFASARAAGCLIWDRRGHGKEHRDPWGVWFPRFDPLGKGMVRLDRSCPAFSNTSSGAMRPTERKGPWARRADPAPDDRGMVNPFFRWDADAIVDRPDRYEIKLWLDDACPLATIEADVTIRNIQRFAVPRGGRLRWRARPADRAGEVEVGMDGLPTIEKLPIPRGRDNGVTLELTHRPDRPAIAIESDTHPDRAPRLAAEARFGWRLMGKDAKPLPVAVKLTRRYDDLPREADRTEKTSLSVGDLGLGVCFLHARLRVDGKWGPVFTKQLYVDRPVVPERSSRLGTPDAIKAGLQNGQRTNE